MTQNNNKRERADGSSKLGRIVFAFEQRVRGTIRKEVKIVIALSSNDTKKKDGIALDIYPSTEFYS
jgi:hypothetical protein